MFRGRGGIHTGGITAAADTEIPILIPPRTNTYTRLTRVQYRCAGTAHTISFLKSLGETTLSAAAAGSQAVINLTADPGTATVAGGIAASDFVCVELSDGTYFLGKVSSVSTLQITLTANLPSAAAALNSVWFFGAPGNHTQTATQHKPTQGYQITATASILNDWGDAASGILQTTGTNEPLMVHSNNATAAGIFEYVGASHTIT